MADYPDIVIPADLPWYGGVYTVSREARDKVGGLDDVTAVCEGRVRRTARAAGHEPYGRVELTWSDYDPDSPEALAVLEGADPPPPDPTDKVWVTVKVRVRPNAVGDMP